MRGNDDVGCRQWKQKECWCKGHNVIQALPSGCVVEREATAELVWEKLLGGHPHIISSKGWESEIEPR